MIIFVDIDQTICWFENTSTSSTMINNYEEVIPYHERILKINNLYDQGHEIVYWTARGSKTDLNWFKTTLNQLDNWECKYTELRMGKPVYDLFIDDKNISSAAFFNC